MMKKFFISMLAGTLMLTGCSEDSAVSQQGGIAVKVEVDSRVIDGNASRGTVEELLGSITPNQLKINIDHESGKHSFAYNSFDEIPEGKRFPIGTYTVTATYGDPEIEGIDQPALSGATTVTVNENRETQVSLTAKVSNCIAKVEYGDNFKEYMTSYYSQLNSSSGLKFNLPQGYTSNLFFKPGSTSVTVHFVKPNGDTGSVTIQAFDAQPQHLYKVTFDIEVRSGLALLTVDFNDEIIPEQKPVDLSKDLSVIPAPYLIARGFDPTNGTPIKFIENLPYDQELDMQVIAMAGLQSVTLSTTSRALCNEATEGKLFPKKVELIGTSEADKELLKWFGLDVRGLWVNPDRMGIIDFGALLKQIRFIDGTNVTEFTVEVTDQFGRKSEPMTLKLAPIELQLSLESTEEFALGMYDEVAHVHVTYNGGLQFADQLRFEYNVGGGWIKAPVVEIRQTPETMNPTNDKYRLCALVKVPGTRENVTIHAHCGEKVSNEAIFTRKGSFMYFDKYYDAQGLNTFATSAKVHVNSGAIDQTTIKVYKRKKGEGDDKWIEAVSTPVNAGDVAAYITVSGLEANTEYEFKATAESSMEGTRGDLVTTDNTCSVHTEPALQLPNGNMDEWYRNPGQTQYWWVDYPGANMYNTVWGTMNQLTTSQGGSSTAWINNDRDGCSYNAYSGTRKEDNGHTNSCAVISTVGWGRGNRAVGNTNNDACRNITVGELYLSGSCDVNGRKANYENYEFTSRPSGMKFWYKYEPKNSADYGLAEVIIYDKNGNQLASGKFNPKSTSQWKNETIQLIYKSDCAKAAYIQVRFKSSDNPSCQTINNDNLNSPGFANTTDGRFTGSEMYIDDIELIY